MKTTTDELRAKIGEIEGRQIELTAERDEHAYAAHVERNAKAQKRLDDIGAELLRLDNEKASLTAAIAEAGRRAQAATAAERAEGERKRAEQAGPIVRRLAERGGKLDAAIQTYCAEYAAIQDDLNELIIMGIPTVSRDLVRVNLRRAHDSATSLLDKTSRPVPPTMRTKFDTLSRGWSQLSLNWIATRLNAAKDAA